tara:strand:+ start:3368 stop:4609 length:1242 start_codon:yes stop_codon:yes gene_type:complete
MASDSKQTADQQSIRLDVKEALSDLNMEERDACHNVLKSSQHTLLKLMPNHHIDQSGELGGFMFVADMNEMAEVMPINKRMFDLSSLYECSAVQNKDEIFHSDALRIINDLSVYRERLAEYIESLTQSSTSPAGFDCMNDNHDSQSLPDQRPWSESVPNTVGLYHGFSRSNTKDRREHKLFIVISGCLHHACEEFQNLWHDCRAHHTCKEVLQSEEVLWLRAATHRNHNRIASAIADICDLTVKRVIDTDDPTGEQRMVLPTTYSYKTDCFLDTRQQVARVVDGGCFLDHDSNGVLFEMYPSEGFWLFQGPRDLSDYHNLYGTQFNYHKTFPCFPTKTVQYHTRFPVKDMRTSVRVVTSSSSTAIVNCEHKDAQDHLFPDESFMQQLHKLGFNRNDGVLNLMPIVYCVNENKA